MDTLTLLEKLAYASQHKITKLIDDAPGEIKDLFLGKDALALRKNFSNKAYFADCEDVVQI